MPFKTREEAVESLKQITVVDPCYKVKRDAEGREVVDEAGDAVWETRDLHPTALVNRDDDRSIIVSAEDGLGFAHYQGQFEGEFAPFDPWVHPLIETWAQQHGYGLDWRDPGSVILWPEAA